MQLKESSSTVSRVIWVSHSIILTWLGR